MKQHSEAANTATVWYQSIEGAAQSGERAAAEVITALGGAVVSGAAS